MFSRDKLHLSRLAEKVEELQRSVCTLEKALENHISPPPVPNPLQIGDKVRGSKTCGFHASMTGVVVFIEPNGTIWVLRNGASSPCMYDRDELVLS